MGATVATVQPVAKYADFAQFEPHCGRSSSGVVGGPPLSHLMGPHPQYIRSPAECVSPPLSTRAPSSRYPGKGARFLGDDSGDFQAARFDGAEFPMIGDTVSTNGPPPASPEPRDISTMVQKMNFMPTYLSLIHI